MENHKRNLYYNIYSSKLINTNNFYNKRKFLENIPLNNLSRVTPSYSGNPQVNRVNIYPPNYPTTLNNNSSFNLYELNIPKRNLNNNQSKNLNNYSSKYTTSSSSLYLNNPRNYFSPYKNNSNISKPIPPPQVSNYGNYKPITKNLSSPYLSIKKPQNMPKRKTLILDLDETLVHSGFNPFTRKSDITLTIKLDGRNHIINVLKRPYVDEFLKEMSEYFDIIIFTASIAEYASPLLDQLDKNNYFSKRLFRNDCLFNHGLYIKDLKIIGKDLKDMIIIDNNPVSYAVNEDNGIPILTWYDDLHDTELNKLVPLLKYLSNVDDVRPIIRQIVNRRNNEVDFYQVNNILSNQNYENDKSKNNLYDNNNNEAYRNRLNNEAMVRNINENRYKNYLDNNDYYNYNKNIDSFSNMSYNEIQNEGHIINNNNFNNIKNNSNNYNINIDQNNNNNIRNNYNEYIRNFDKTNNNYLPRNYNEDDNMLIRTNQLLNQPQINNNFSSDNNKNNYPQRYNEEKRNYEIERIPNYYDNNNNQINNNYNIRNNLSNNRSYTPNINIQKRAKASYYNDNRKTVNAPYLNIENNNKENNIQLNRLNNNNHNRLSNNFNNRSTPNIFTNTKKIVDIKMNNYLNKENPPEKPKEKENNERLNDYYLESYKQHLLRSKQRGKNQNYNILNRSVYINNNTPDKNSNKPIYNTNTHNSEINRNFDINERYNNRTNNNLYPDYNQKLYDYENYRNNSNYLRTPNRNEFSNNNRDNYEENRNEYLERDNRKNEINNNIKKDNYFYGIRNNIPFNNIKERNDEIINNNYKEFLKENDNNQTNNNYYNNNINNYLNNKEISQKVNNYYIRNKDNDILNRTFSAEKRNTVNNYTPDININKNERYTFNRFLYNNIPKIENDRNIPNNTPYYANHRTDTEISTNKYKNYIANNNDQNNNYKENENNRSTIITEKRSEYSNTINRDNYNRSTQFNPNHSRIFNDEKKYRYLNEINRTEERRYPPNYNLLYNKYKEADDNEFSNIRNNYNNININNYNFYNSLSDENNRAKNINNNENINSKYKLNKVEENNNDDIKQMNKSSSNFHPRTMINSFFSLAEDKNKDIKNNNRENEYIYNYKNNKQTNEINRNNNYSKDNSISPFSINRNNLLRNKYLYNYNNMKDD